MAGLVISAGAVVQSNTPAAEAGQAESRDLRSDLPLEAAGLPFLREVLGGSPQTLETSHFVLVYDPDTAAAPRMARRLEAVYRTTARMARDLDLPAKRPGAKLPVAIFATHARFQAYLRSIDSADVETLGFYDPRQRCSVFFDLDTHPSVSDLRQQIEQLDASSARERARLERKLGRTSEMLLAKIVQHEAAHQALDQTGLLSEGAGVPVWLTEGMAEMFELPLVEQAATLELSTNQYRLREFAKLHANESELLPDLKRMVEAGENSWHGGPDYSLAWAMTNYLYKRHRDALADYLREFEVAVDRVASSGRSPVPQTQPVATTSRSAVERFESHFGQVNGELADRLGAFMRRLESRYGVGRQRD